MTLTEPSSCHSSEYYRLNIPALGDASPDSFKGKLLHRVGLCELCKEKADELLKLILDYTYQSASS